MIHLDKLVIYPNAITKQRGGDRKFRGALRSGMVEVNEGTIEAGTAGLFASVTHEAEGFARAYVFLLDGECPMWQGPHMFLSEEVVS